eukprot:5720791-Prymnesium_polylepis.1
MKAEFGSGRYDGLVMPDRAICARVLAMASSLPAACCAAIAALSRSTMPGMPLRGQDSSVALRGQQRRNHTSLYLESANTSTRSHPYGLVWPMAD